MGDAEAAEHITIESASSDDLRTLEVLGVRASSVLLANATIWVEGITDRQYYRRYFELYQETQVRKFLEDIHYAFLEYGGSNIAHWNWLDEAGMNAKRIAHRVFLIADGGSPDRLAGRHERLTDALGDHYRRLNVYEVENLLTKSVLLHVLRDYENDAVLREDFTARQYSTKPLAKFIEERILPDAKSNRKHEPHNRPYAKADGTLKDKVGFSKRALEHLKSVDDLSDEAKALAQAMYEFVSDANQ